MTYRIARKSLAALLLCGAVLAGCGGDADAPPPVGGAPGPGPDTTPPTVSIASDVSVPKATGPVTFTFVFSEDVGVSFEQADILVSGGTGGPFTRVDGRQATLVVTPTPGVAGTMTVSVGPGSFTDIAGNANTDAAAASQDFMATQTINFASPGNQTIGQPTPALNATASSGLPVTINSTTPGVCTVSGTALTLVAAGSCSLVATQTGDANFAPAPAVTQTFSVAGSGGGGGVSDVVFSSGFAAGNRTVEGGEFGGFSGSNLDGFNCTGGPAWCGGGGDTVPAVPAADSFFFYYYQTPSPATDLYMGIYVLAPGVTGGLNPSGDTAGVQINGQTSIRFKVGQNAEWFGTATNKFAVNLELGKRYVAGGNTCRLQLRAIVTPTASAATQYTVPFSAFSVVQDCGQGLTVAQALAASPISQVSFQAGAGGPALSAGGQTTGANLSVPVGGVYPTTLVLVGGISFEP
jgi:hypothetical protein